MICYICKKEFESINGNLICSDCETVYLYSAMVYAFDEWNKSVLLEDQFWNGSKIYVKGLIEKMNKKDSIIKQATELLEKIKEQIIVHLKFYNKDEVIVGLLTIKEAVRRMQIKINNEDIGWSYINDYQLSIRLISFIINIPEDKFYEASLGHLENGYSNFISAICLGRMYEILDENIKNIRCLNINLKSVDELAFKFIETEEMKKYFEEYWEMGLDEKPEDYKIKNGTLNAKVEQEGKTPNCRRESVNPFIKKTFGFTLDQLQFLSSLIMREEFDNEDDFLAYCADIEIYGDSVPYLSIFNKEVFKKTLIKYFEDISFDNIVNTFSINKFASTDQKDEKAFELMSVYETGALIILGRLDFIQNISAFDKFANSGHYIDMFKPSIKGDKSIIESQKRLSSYMAYVIADRLFSKGYKLPMEKLSRELVPRAEINKIEVNGSNILSGLGDLDVLAIDQKNKHILLFEIKNYKPAIDSKSLFYKDKSKIEDEEIIRKIIAREDAIKNYIPNVVEYILGKEEAGYSVKSIFVTSRPNYYVCNKKTEIQYITWHKLIKKIEAKEL